MTVKRELETMKELVTHILKTQPKTRNSDTVLYIECCKYMGATTLEDLESLGLNIITVHKIRQVIQNKDGLFPPDKNVKEERARRRFSIKGYMSNLL